MKKILMKHGDLYKFKTNFDSITYSMFCYIIIMLCALLYTEIFNFTGIFAFINGVIFGLFIWPMSDFKNMFDEEDDLFWTGDEDE